MQGHWNLTLAICLGGCVLSPVWAHGTSHASHSAPVIKEQQAWGIAGEPGAVTRTIVVTMGDDMRFQPGQLRVKRGETIRFRVRNTGKLMHEFVLGTQEENHKHAELMLKFPNMEHDAPYMAHVAPGKHADMVWHFNRAGTFYFACLIAGHYQSGMVGTIVVEKT